jgi:hypothetical protein
VDAKDCSANQTQTQSLVNVLVNVLRYFSDFATKE